MTTDQIFAQMRQRTGNIGGSVVLPHTQNPNRPEFQGTLPWGQQLATGKGKGQMGLNDIMAALDQQQAQANQANEARYAQLLQMADQYGAGQRQQSMDLTQQQQALAGSNLMSRGLGNSTIVNSVQQGIARQGQRTLADIDDRVTQNKMGIVERRTDKGPDLGLYAQLLMQKGAL